MPRKRETPGIQAYYETLQRVFNLQSEILTGALPHYGERGRNDEERFRDFLRKVLPRRFSIGTGFIICSEASIPPSSQTDVVIFDEIQNSPLYRELSAFVYPVEMVYGAIEVKGVLRKRDLKKILVDVQKIRELAPHKWYVRYTSIPKKSDKPRQLVTQPKEFQDTLPPRTFLFAYDQKGWRTLDHFVDSLREALGENPHAHLHGVAVLSKNWFALQVPYGEKGVEIISYPRNSLLAFVNKLIHSMASVPIYQMSVNRYLRF